MKDTKLVDAGGQPIRTVTVPVIKYKNFSIPIRIVQKEDRVNPTTEGIRPMELLKEVRAMYLELQDRFVVLATLLSVVAKTDPELDSAMSQMGITLKDMNEEFIYKPDPSKMDQVAPKT